MPALSLAARWRLATTQLSPIVWNTVAKTAISTLVWNTQRSMLYRGSREARRYTDWRFTGAGVAAISLLCRTSCPSRTARSPVWATTVSFVVVTLPSLSIILRARRLALMTPRRPKVLLLRSLLRAGPTCWVLVSWL